MSKPKEARALKNFCRIHLSRFDIIPVNYIFFVGNFKMAKPYNLGSKNQVLTSMARYAIRDQRALLDALQPPFGEPDEATATTIAEVRERIEDFRRILKLLQGGER